MCVCLRGAYVLLPYVEARGQLSGVSSFLPLIDSKA